MNELSKAAAILGKKGGESGTGASKARPSDVARLAAIRRWALYKFGTVEERFWRKVQKGSETECWLWTANLNSKGYGMFDSNSEKHKSRLAPRVSWELTNGPIPEGMKVLHKCDNPPCVNPHHLYLGTQKQNIRDSIQRGRYCVMNGSKDGNAKLKEEDAIQIRRIRSEEGLSMNQIANLYGVSKRTIQFIVHRKTWKHV